MRHLQKEELVGLVFDELAGKEWESCQSHLRTCPECEAAFEALARAVSLLQNEPTEAPPPFAWARLKARIDKSGPGRDWTDPAWVPLIVRNVAGMILVLLFIFLAGGWLSTTTLWQSLRTYRLAAEIGPRGLMTILFFCAGSIATLALAPILWWESRRPRNGAVQ
jgi:hypothetical protein